MVKVAPWQCPSSAPAPPVRAWRLWAARHSQGEAGALGAQPQPQVLKPAASKGRLSFDHAGAAALIKQHVPTYEAEHVARPATSFFSPRAPEEQILHRGFR